MKIRKSTILKVVGIGVFLFFLFASWYKLTYSMEKVETLELDSPTLTQKILIATQGSAYKEKILTDLIDHFVDRSVYIKIIDISGLKDIDETKWSAICLIHTWEFSKPPKPIKEFINRPLEMDRLVILTTSGNGAYQMKEVDGITGASILEEAPGKAKQLIGQVENILKKEKRNNKNAGMKKYFFSPKFSVNATGARPSIGQTIY